VKTLVILDSLEIVYFLLLTGLNGVEVLAHWECTGRKMSRFFWREFTAFSLSAAFVYFQWIQPRRLKFREARKAC
jgi:hypothetical protein